MSLTTPEVDARLREVSKAMAESLSFDSFRAIVYAALQTSPQREQKVRLRSLIEKLPQGERSLIEGRLSARPGGLRALLDSIPDLVLYLPVPDHRERWIGSSDIVVGSLLSDERHPAGYDLTGQPFILSGDKPPDIPVLALVSSELPKQSSEALMEDEPSNASMAAGPYSYGSLSAGVYMTRSTIYHVSQYEHWMLGDPEIELHVFTLGSGGELEWASCVGEQNTSFDQNEDTWIGSVRVASVPNSPTPPGGLPVHLQLWECDYNCCDFKDGQYVGQPRPNAQVRDYLNAIAALGGFALMLSNGEYWYAFLMGVWTLQVTSSLNPDDFVGHLRPKRNDCWEDSEGSIRYYAHSAQGLTGYVDLDLVGLERTGAICPNATISGPTEVSSTSTVYQWEAQNPSGGDGTYAFSWARRFDWPGSAWESLGGGSILNMVFPDNESAMHLRLSVVSQDITTHVFLYVQRVDVQCPPPEVVC